LRRNALIHPTFHAEPDNEVGKTSSASFFYYYFVLFLNAPLSSFFVVSALSAFTKLVFFAKTTQRM
jgi:hypothetical protein